VARHVKSLKRFPPEYRAAYAALTRLLAAVLTRAPGRARRRLARALDL